MEYTNSPLVSYTKLSPNHSGTRTHSLDTITPHCVVGKLSCESICGCFTSTSRQASCNYGIGTDGRVSLCVEEKNRSWCSSSRSNDQRAITIECASDRTHPYAMNDAVYKSLIDLCVDICKRNGKDTLVWPGDKESAINYEPKSNEMKLTAHRFFANKACPGDWLYSRFGDLARQVTERLGGKATSGDTSKPEASGEVLYRVQVGAFRNKANAEGLLAKLKQAGFNGYIVEAGTKTPMKPAEPPMIKVGDTVTLDAGARTYEGRLLSSFVYAREYTVKQINGDRVVIAYHGTIVAAVHMKDLNRA